MAKKNDFDSLQMPPEDFRPVHAPAPKKSPPRREEAAKPAEAAPETPKPAVAPKAPPPPPPLPSIAPKSKVTARLAAEICRLFALGKEARQLLKPDLTTRRFLELLIEKEHYDDAVRFMAHALPKREAVWWSCQCARQIYGAALRPRAAKALQAAEAWASSPTEEHRRAAMRSAEDAGLGTPPGCTAAAAFWSGGSIAPPDAPITPPVETLTATSVAGSILLAAVLSEPEKAPVKFRAFLTLGVEVANGSNRWRRE